MKSYFKLSEFFVGCKPSEIDKVLNDENLTCNLFELFECINSLRHEFGYPILITSGFRDKDHNLRVGGVSNSWHMKMCAVDIQPIGSEPGLFQKLVDCVDDNHDLFPEVVIHKGYIHLSIYD